MFGTTRNWRKQTIFCLVAVNLAVYRSGERCRICHKSQKTLDVIRAGGGTRTRTALSSQRILSPLCLPFHHPGNSDRLRSSLPRAPLSILAKRLFGDSAASAFFKSAARTRSDSRAGPPCQRGFAKPRAQREAPSAG